MGGKTGTTTQSVNIPPEVLARYNAVNAKAETTAQQPFQQYSTDPSSFVAQLNQQQQQGISNVNQYAGAAQPGYQAAMQGTAGAYGGLTPQGFQQGVQGYMSPFLSNAMGATAAQMQNVNRQQQQDIIGNAVKSGAFGGDRGAIARAALANQQNLAMGQTLGNMAQQGYQSAAQNYLTGIGQQGALSAQMGQLGAGAQQAGLQGAQAQIGAGTLGQQTEQAGKTALYNQFLQQQAYPFQVAQFLANIAMGTGALSGNQTTTTQPMSFFSDRRLKEDIKRIGETDEGLPIYKFKYKGDPEEQTHVGFMADEVEKIHPEAVGHSHGYKTVDYDKATSEGGAVHEKHAGLGFALGGTPTAMDYGSYNPYDPNNIQNIISRQQAIFATPESHYVPLARQISGGFGKHSRVPDANLPVSQLKTAGPAPALPESMLKQGLGAATDVTDLATKGKDLYKFYQGLKIKDDSTEDKSSSNKAYGGRIGYDLGGGLNPEASKEKDETPQGLYSAEQTGKLNIPTESKNYKLAQQSMLPGSMQDPTMRDIMTIVGMFKSHGGSIGREHHAGSEGNVVGESSLEKRGKIISDKEFGPYKFEPTPEEAAGVNPALINALQRGATAALPEGYHARFVSGHRDVNPEHPSSMHSISGPAKATDIEIVNPEGKALPNYQDPRFFKPYHDVAKSTLDYLEQKDPELAKRFSWGGLFSGPPGKYGAMDTMHYSLDEPMAGGTIKEGLNPEQEALFRGYTPASAKAALAAKAEPSTLDKLADMVGFTKANAQEIKEKNLQGADSTDLLLSILAGAGTMASSNSPFLGAAILQGIGGGAKTYAGLRGQALERALAQQGVDISGRQLDITARTQGIQALKYLQDRFKPRYDATGSQIIGYIDMNGGAVSIPQYNSIMQNAAVELGLSPSMVPQAGGLNVTGEQPVAPIGATTDTSGLGAAAKVREDRAAPQLPTSDQQQNVVVAGHGVIPLSHLTDPDKIQETINNLRAQFGLAEPSTKPLIQSEIVRLENSLTKITDIASAPQVVYDAITGEKRSIPGVDYIRVVKDAHLDPNGRAKLPDGTEVTTGVPQYAESNQKILSDNLNRSAEYVNNWKTARNMLTSLAHVYQNAQAGPPSEQWGLINGIMKFFGQEPFDPKGATAYDAAMKTAVNLAINRTSEFATGAPAAGLEASMMASPDPKKDPDALYDIITKAIGYGDMNYDRSQQLLKNKPKDALTFISTFADKNDPQRYLEKARDEIGPFKGSTEEGAAVTGGRGPKSAIPVDENTVALPKGASAMEINKIILNTPKSKRVDLGNGQFVQGRGK